MVLYQGTALQAAENSVVLAGDDVRKKYARNKRRAEGDVQLCASSAESVGGFRFGQSSECVIEGHFHRFEGAKAVGSSGYHTDFVIEPFDRAARKLPFGAEPVEQQFLMIAQHASNFLHRFESAAQGAVAPGIEKARRPEGRLVRPEVQECLLQLPGPGRVQFAGEQGVELLAGFAAHPASLAQQRPAHVLELLGVVFALGFQAGSLRPAHLIDRTRPGKSVVDGSGQPGIGYFAILAA